MIKEKILIEFETLKKENRFRTLTKLNDDLLNFSSNDYIGLNSDIALRKEFYNSINNLPLSSSSSRLISGSYDIVLELEETIKNIYGKPALVFNSGFDCNSCVIETFFDKDSLILSDRLNHASIYDGIIHSEAKLLRYKHLDLSNLKSLLLKYSKKYNNILVISETIYSMDGDLVDLDELIALKKEFNFLLMIDEAHSYGVHGYGIAYEKKYIDYIDFLTIPLGKGGGSNGCYLICDQIYKDYIINKGRHFIYTTALPPINNAWNLFILKKLNDFEEKRKKLDLLTTHAHELIKKYNLVTFSNTHIISIVIGNNFKLDKIIKHLVSKGFFVYGVKEPTVPKGSSRIRVGLTPEITLEQLDIFFKELNYAINSIF